MVLLALILKSFPLQLTLLTHLIVDIVKNFKGPRTFHVPLFCITCRSYPATDCMTLLDMSLMLLKRLLAPFTTPPSKAEFPGEGGTGGPLVLPER